MQTYYYDDDCILDHWKKREFTSKEEAITWAESLVARYKPKSAILYTESNTPNGLPFITIKEW